MDRPTAMNKSILLLISLALTLCGCRENAPTASERHQKQILSMGISSEPTSLDPGRVTDATSITLLHMLFEGLTRPSFGNPCQLAIAEMIDVSPDGKTYVFHLRKTHWSNGDPLTAHDFEFAWKRLLAPDYPAEHASMLYTIKGAQAAKERKGSLKDVGVIATDDYTLTVILNHPNPAFLDLLQLEPFLPVHRASTQENPNWAVEAGTHFVSNGPFILHQWKHHDRLTVKRNPSYWDSPSVRLTSILIHVIDRGDTELGLFEQCTLDWGIISKDHPPEVLEDLRSAGKIVDTPHGSTFFYMFNVNQFPFNHIKLRQALGYAINRRLIVDHVLVNGEQVTTRMLPLALAITDEPGFKDNDIESARRLFQEALLEIGVTKEQLPIIPLTYYISDHQHKIAQIIQDQWKTALGVEVQLCAQEWKVFLENLCQKQFTIAALGLKASYADPLFFMQDWATSDCRNRPSWYNYYYSRLIEEAEQALSFSGQASALIQAETLILKEMPLIPIFSYGNSYLRHPYLKQFLISPTGRVDLRYAYFETPEQDIELQRPNE